MRSRDAKSCVSVPSGGPVLHVETQNLASPLRPDVVILSWRRKILRLYIVALMGDVGPRLGVAVFSRLGLLTPGGRASE